MSGPRLLYVEDDPDILDALRCVLEREGYEVTAVSTAEDGLAELTRNRYEIVLTDYQLPGHDGAWLLRSAMTAGHLERVSVIVLTAHDDPVGLDGHVVLRKPVDLDVLLATLARAVDVAAPSQPPPPSITRSSPCVVLTLYITGQAPSSLRALRHVRAALAEFAPGQVELHIHDVAEATRRASLAEALESDRVVVTPTLIRKNPAPPVWVVGDLARPGVVAELIRGALPHSDQPVVADRTSEGQIRADR